MEKKKLFYRRPMTGSIEIYWNLLFQENLLTGDYHSHCEDEANKSYSLPLI